MEIFSLVEKIIYSVKPDMWNNMLKINILKKQFFFTLDKI